MNGNNIAPPYSTFPWTPTITDNVVGYKWRSYRILTVVLVPCALIKIIRHLAVGIFKYFSSGSSTSDIIAWTRFSILRDLQECAGYIYLIVPFCNSSGLKVVINALKYKNAYDAHLKIRSDQRTQTSISDKLPSCITQEILSDLSVKELLGLRLVNKEMDKPIEKAIIRRANRWGLQNDLQDPKKDELTRAKDYIKNIFKEAKTYDKIIPKKYLYVKDKILFEPEEILRNIEKLSDEEFFDIVLKAIPTKRDGYVNSNPYYGNTQNYLFKFLCEIASSRLKENKLGIAGKIKERVNKEKNTFSTFSAGFMFGRANCGILEDVFIDRLRLLLIMGMDPNFTLPLNKSISSLCNRNDKSNSKLEESTLSIALYLKQPQIAQLLLEWGAQPNRITEDQTFPLEIAIQLNDAILVRLLLDKGADLKNSSFYSVCPRGFAAAFASKQILEMILNHEKSKIDVVDENGSTALMFASQFCWGKYKDMNKEKIKFLLDEKADINIRNNYGLTALEYYKESAKEYPNEIIDNEIIDLLTPQEK